MSRAGLGNMQCEGRATPLKDMCLAAFAHHHMLAFVAPLQQEMHLAMLVTVLRSSQCIQADCAFNNPVTSPDSAPDAVAVLACDMQQVLRCSIRFVSGLVTCS